MPTSPVAARRSLPSNPWILSFSGRSASAGWRVSPRSSWWSLFTALSFGLHGCDRRRHGPVPARRPDRHDRPGCADRPRHPGVHPAAGARRRRRASRSATSSAAYDLPWSVVRAVRFDRNSAWATLELHDDETGAGARAAGGRQGVRGRGRTRTSGPAYRCRRRLIDLPLVDHAPVLCDRSPGRERGARRFPPCHPFGGRVRSTASGNIPGAVRVLMDADDRSSGPWHAPGPSAFPSPPDTRAVSGADRHWQRLRRRRRS